MDYIKKQNIIVIIFAATMMIIIFAIIVLSFGQKKPLQESPSAPTNTPSFITPSAPVVEYNTEKSKELIKKLKNRQVLSQEDKLAKEKILSQLPAGQTSGVLNKTGNITIDYVNSADIFQVEILTKDINRAKSEAIQWFNSQGVSQEGICNYPVQFYLNYEVSQSLRNSNIKFNPLAEEC